MGKPIKTDTFNPDLVNYRSDPSGSMDDPAADKFCNSSLPPEAPNDNFTSEEFGSIWANTFCKEILKDTHFARSFAARTGLPLAKVLENYSPEIVQYLLKIEESFSPSEVEVIFSRYYSSFNTDRLRSITENIELLYEIKRELLKITPEGTAADKSWEKILSDLPAPAILDSGELFKETIKIFFESLKELDQSERVETFVNFYTTIGANRSIFNENVKNCGTDFFDLLNRIAGFSNQGESARLALKALVDLFSERTIKNPEKFIETLSSLNSALEGITSICGDGTLKFMASSIFGNISGYEMVIMAGTLNGAKEVISQKDGEENLERYKDQIISIIDISDIAIIKDSISRTVSGISDFFKNIPLTILGTEIDLILEYIKLQYKYAKPFTEATSSYLSVIKKAETSKNHDLLFTKNSENNLLYFLLLDAAGYSREEIALFLDKPEEEKFSTKLKNPFYYTNSSFQFLSDLVKREPLSGSRYKWVLENISFEKFDFSSDYKDFPFPTEHEGGLRADLYKKLFFEHLIPFFKKPGNLSWVLKDFYDPLSGLLKVAGQDSDKLSALTTIIANIMFDGDYIDVARELNTIFPNQNLYTFSPLELWNFFVDKLKIKSSDFDKVLEDFGYLLRETREELVKYEAANLQRLEIKKQTLSCLRSMAKSGYEGGPQDDNIVVFITEKGLTQFNFSSSIGEFLGENTRVTPAFRNGIYPIFLDHWERELNEIRWGGRCYRAQDLGTNYAYDDSCRSEAQNMDFINSYAKTVSLTNLDSTVIDLLINYQKEMVALFDIFSPFEINRLISRQELSGVDYLMTLIDSKDFILSLRKVFAERFRPSDFKGIQIGVYGSGALRREYYAFGKEDITLYLPNKSFLKECKEEVLQFFIAISKLEAKDKLELLDVATIALTPKNSEKFEAFLRDNKKILFDFLNIWMEKSSRDKGELSDFIKAVFNLADGDLGNHFPKIIDLAKKISGEDQRLFKQIVTEITIDAANNKDKIKKYGDKLYLLFENIKKPAEGKRFKSFIGVIPDYLMENDPDLVFKIVSKYENPYDIFKSIGEQTNIPTMKALIEKDEKGLAAEYLRFADYFGIVEFPVGKLVKTMNANEHLLPETLLFDYKTNHDLKLPDISEKAVYQKLFETIRSANLTDMEQVVIKMIDFSDYLSRITPENIFKIISEISDIANIVGGSFKNSLFKGQLLEKIDSEGLITRILFRWLDTTSDTIVVSQKNISEVNSLFEFLIYLAESKTSFDLEKQLKGVFPLAEFRWNTLPDLIVWLAGKCNVEEIDYSQMRGADLFAQYISLIENMHKLQSRAAEKYLSNKFGEMDIYQFFKESFKGEKNVATDIATVERIRQAVNGRNRHLGDQFVRQMAGNFLKEHAPSYDNISALMEFGKIWSLSDSSSIHRDVRGLYIQMSYFALGMVADFIRHELSTEAPIEKEFNNRGLRLNEMIDYLEARGFIINEESWYKKYPKTAVNHPQYFFTKGSGKYITGTSNFVVDGETLVPTKSEWPKRRGVDVYEIMKGDTVAAVAIQCKRNSTKIKIRAEKSGTVNTKDVVSGLGKRYIFSAPLNMSTGERKMTEIAFEDGIQINYLLTPHGKDGFLLVDVDGSPKILDKRKIKIGDMLSAKDLEDSDISRAVSAWLKSNGLAQILPGQLLSMSLAPETNFFDNCLFTEIMAAKKYSLLCGMLLIEDGNPNFIGNDGPDMRRLFVEFGDGTYGIIDSEERMNTNSLVRIALQMGAVRAIYMDTGMYDSATYRDGNGVDHMLGHNDTEESTNRVFIYSADGMTQIP